MPFNDPEAWKKVQAEKLSENPYGLNDTKTSAGAGRSKRKTYDYQKLQYNKAETELKQAVARGLVSAEAADLALQEGMGMSRGSWLQRAMFDRVPEALGSDPNMQVDPRGQLGEFMGGFATQVTGSQAIGKFYNREGTFLETLGDALSVVDYATASFSREATKASMRDYNLAGIGGAGVGAVAGGLLGGPMGALAGAGVGGVLGTIFDPGFTSEGYWQAYRNRTSWFSYSDEFGLFEENNPLAAVGTGLSMAGANTIGDVLSLTGGENPKIKFVGGMAMDIALDPLTYLTFGVSAGAKLGATVRLVADAGQVVAKTGKLAKHAGKPLTLTRLGKRIYDLAAEQMVPRIRQMAMSDAHPLDQAISSVLHQEIGEHAVRHFDELYQEMVNRSAGKLSRFGAPAGQANQDVVRHMGSAFKVEDMFQETAGIATREIGLYSTKGIQETLAKGRTANALLGAGLGGLVGGPVGAVVGAAGGAVLPRVGGPQAFHALFDVFDKGWNAPPDVVEKARLTQVYIREAFDAKNLEFQQHFSRLPAEARRAVTRAVEDRDTWRQTGVATLGSVAPWADDIEESIKYVEREMEEMLQHERSRGFDTQRVKDYITHYYGHTPVREAYVKDVIFKNGEESWDTVKSFTQQRMIATLAEGRDLFGKEALLDDAYEILAHRKRASLEMIEKTEFARYIVKKHGIPAFMVHAQMEGMSKGIIRGMFRRVSQGMSEVLPYNQVWQAEIGNLKKLGFSQGEDAYNQRLLRYLQRPNDASDVGKLGPAGLKEADELQVNNQAQLHAVEIGEKTVNVGGAGAISVATGPIPETYHWSPKPLLKKSLRSSRDPASFKKGKLPKSKIGVEKIAQEGTEVPVHIALDMLQNAEHPGWWRVFQDNVTGTTVNPTRALGFADGLHRYLSKYLDVPLLGYMPDVDRRLMDAYKANMRRVGKEPTKEMLDAFTKESAKYFDTHTMPVELRKLVPGVPEALIDLARQTREAAGNLADMSAFHPWQKRQIIELAGKLGFDGDTLQAWLRVAINKPDVETAAEADIVIDTMRIIADDGPISRALGTNTKSAATAVPVRRFADQKMVMRRLLVTRQASGNIIPEIFDHPLGIPSPEAIPHTTTPYGKVVAEAEKADLTDLTPLKPRMAIADSLSEGGTPLSTVQKGPAQVKLKKEVLSKETVAHEAKLALKQLIDTEPKIGHIAVLRQQMSDHRSFLRAYAKFKTLLGKEGQKLAEADLLTAGRKVFGDDWNPKVETMDYKGGMPKVYETFAESVEAKLKTFNKSWRKLGGAKLWKEWRAHYAKTKTAKLHAANTLEDLNRTRRKYEKIAGRNTVAAGGLEPGGARIVQTPTPSDELLQAREEIGLLKQALKSLDGDVAPVKHQELTTQLTAAEAKYRRAHEVMVGLNQGRDNLPIRDGVDPFNFDGTIPGSKTVQLPEAANLDKYSGGLRPDTSSVSIDLYLPEGVAGMVDEVFTPLIDPKLQGFWRHMLVGFDKFQAFAKTNLTLPWGGTWMRNMSSNALLTTMGIGAKMFSPRNNFGFARDYFSVLSYMLLKHSDYGTALGLERATIDGITGTLAGRTIASATGRVLRLDEFVKDAILRGVHRGQPSGDIMDSMAMGRRLSGGVSGAFAGAALGMMAPAGPIGAGIVGSIASLSQTGMNKGAILKAAGVGTAAAVAGAALTGDDAETNWKVAGFASVIGGAMGAYFGGKRISVTRAGIPVPMGNRITGLLQAQWNPFLRAGEASTDMPFRLATFLSDFQDTGSMMSATNTMMRHLNDWNSLSIVERRYMRRIVPFYAWTKHAVAQSVVTLAENPGREANIMKFFRDWNEQHGADPEDVPDFYHERLTMMANSDSPYIGAFMPKGTDSVITGLGLPIEDVAALATGLDLRGEAGSDNFLRMVVSRGAFGPVALAENPWFGFNTDTFTARRIDSDTEITYFAKGDNWESAPGWLQKIVGYEKPTPDSIARVNPKIAWLLGEIPTSRFVMLMKSVYEMDEAGLRQVNPYTMARTFLGPNVYKVDPETGKHFVNQGKVNALTRLLIHAGALRKYEWYSDVNKDDKDYKSRGSRYGGRGSTLHKRRPRTIP